MRITVTLWYPASVPPVPMMFTSELDTAEGRAFRGDEGHLTLGERIASQSEVIRAIVSGYSPRLWCPGPSLAPWPDRT